MKLYKPSIFTSDLDFRQSLTFSGAVSGDTAVDNDRYTILRSATLNPDFTLTMDTGGAQVADSVWLRTLGYTNVEIFADTVSLGSFTIDSTGYVYAEFARTTALVWTLRFTGTGGIWEAYLQETILDFDIPSKRPLKWRVARFPGIFERAASGALLFLTPFGFGGGAATVTLEWTLLDNESTAELFTAWRTGAPRNRQVGIYPVPTFRPRYFFQAQWISEFNFQYTGTKIADGQSGTAIFQEVDVRL